MYLFTVILLIIVHYLGRRGRQRQTG